MSRATLGALALTLTLLLWALAPSAATAGELYWSSPETISQTSKDDTASLSCASITLCVVAGQTQNPGGADAGSGNPYVASTVDPTAQTPRWELGEDNNGNPAVGYEVSCPPGGTFCMTVAGKEFDEISTNAGDPTSWRSGTVQDAAYGYPAAPLSAVSCTRPSFGILCLAGDLDGELLVDKWPNSWFYAHSTYDGDPVAGISCVDTFCAAAAVDSTSNGDHTIAFSSYADQPGAGNWVDEFFPAQGKLTGVSCPAVGVCVITSSAGYVYKQTLPPGGGSSTVDVDKYPLTGVSCTPTLCVAIDDHGQAFTSYDEGASWSGPQDLDGAVPLLSVSCTSEDVCVIGTVGRAVPTSGPATPGQTQVIVGAPAPPGYPLVQVLPQEVKTNPPADSVTVFGEVIPNGSAVTDCRFLYGPPPSLTYSVPCTFAPSGDGYQVSKVSAQLVGLSQGQSYSYALQATNAAGTWRSSVAFLNFGEPPANPWSLTVAAKLGAALASVFGGESDIASVCALEQSLQKKFSGVIPFLAATRICAAFGETGVSMGGLANQILALSSGHDPPDPSYAQLALLRTPAVPALAKRCPKHVSKSPCAAIRRAFGGYLAATVRVSSLMTVLRVTANRFLVARRLRAGAAEATQAAAARAYAGMLTAALERQRSLGGALAKRLAERRLNVRVSAAAVRRATRVPSAKLLRTAVFKQLLRAGYSRSEIKAALSYARAHGRSGAVNLQALLRRTVSAGPFTQGYDLISFSDVSALTGALLKQRAMTPSSARALNQDLVRAQAACSKARRRVALHQLLVASQQDLSARYRAVFATALTPLSDASRQNPYPRCSG